METNGTRAEKPTDDCTEIPDDDTPAGEIDPAELARRKRRSSTPRMERVSFRLSPTLLDAVDAAVERDEYATRSDALRAAVRQQFPQPDGGHPPGQTAGTTTLGDAQPATDPTLADVTDAQWRLRYRVGELAHYTAWTSDFATVENLYHQYRNGEYGHDVTIERRTEVRQDGE